MFCVTVSTGARMSALDILPNELIVCILQWLGASDLTKVALTCKWLHALTRLDTLWQRLCEQGVCMHSTCVCVCVCVCLSLSSLQSLEWLTV